MVGTPRYMETPAHINIGCTCIWERRRNIREKVQFSFLIGIKAIFLFLWMKAHSLGELSSSLQEPEAITFTGLRAQRTQLQTAHILAFCPEHVPIDS